MWACPSDNKKWLHLIHFMLLLAFFHVTIYLGDFSILAQIDLFYLFIFKTTWHSVLWMCHNFLNHFPFEGCLCHSQSFVLTENRAMKVFLCISLHTSVSLSVE